MRLIKEYIDGRNIKQASKLCNINYSTAKMIVKAYVKSNNLNIIKGKVSSDDRLSH